MNRRRIFITIMAFLALLIAGGGIFYLWFSQQTDFAGWVGPGEESLLTLPHGFSANIFASGLVAPRFMHVGPDGVLYVAERGKDRIVALPDADGDGMADEVRVVAGNIPAPHSLVYYRDAWYVGITSGIVRLWDADGDGIVDEQETLIDDYGDGGHSTRTVIFLPDGRMAVSVGSSCNVCEEEDPRRAAIVVYDDENAGGEAIFAEGLRNAVGLDIHPETGSLWATNNGRDLMGDDLPPETLFVVREGAHYGWPYCHSGWLVDPDLGKANSCDDVPFPVLDMQAHSAPLGLTFYTADIFPQMYQDMLFIAFHGSWNRSELTGYKVIAVRVHGDQVIGPPVDFATGWLDEESGEVSGRPVGVTVGADGALYVSDDKGGFIYRIVYDG